MQKTSSIRKAIQLLKLQSIVIVCAVILATIGSASAIATGELAPDNMKVPQLVPEESISTYVPSESAPGKGLAVNILYAAKPRYNDGAPVVVIAPGGTGASDGIKFNMHAAQSGFIEVRFALPSGGVKGFTSGGIYDNRGSQSQEALKDVILFASSQKEDYQGKTIGDLIPVAVSQKNLGVVGWDTGGNLLIPALARYSEQLACVKWVAFYECPIGAMFSPSNLGGIHDLMLNTHYRQGSAATGRCLVDYRKLSWQPDAKRYPGVRRKLGETELKGVLFFDENKNKLWEESAEFAFTYATDVGLNKQIYPPDVTNAMERLKLFVVKEKPTPKKKTEAELEKEAEEAKKKEPSKLLKVFGAKKKEETEEEKKKAEQKKKEEETLVDKLRWPETIATLAESEAYFQERDGSLYIADVAKAFPNLMVGIFGSDVDHMQRQPDHPHIALQYNAWLDSKIGWLRLNPDPMYVASLAQMNMRNFVNNAPSMAIDASTMDTFLEPEGILPDYVYMEAMISELADRYRTNNLKHPLGALLINYNNGSQPQLNAPQTPKKEAEEQ